MLAALDATEPRAPVGGSNRTAEPAPDSLPAPQDSPDDELFAWIGSGLRDFRGTGVLPPDCWGF